MREFDLPYVPPAMGLGAALALCREAGRGALVTERPEGDVLITVEDMLERWNALVERKRDPAGVPVSRVVPRRAPAPPPARGMAEGGADPDAVRTEALESLRSMDDPRYVVVRTEGARAHLISHSELLAEAMSHPVIECTCEGSPPHRFPARRLRESGKCIYPHALRVDCG